jgi:quercetin dioxygenase-like cupin family protein
MPFVDTNKRPQQERRPGWLSRYFHSPSMTFAHWTITAGSDIYEHGHEQEQVWEVIEGQLAVTIDGEAHIAGAGMIAIVPANTAHSVVAITDGKAIVIDYPLRPEP